MQQPPPGPTTEDNNKLPRLGSPERRKKPKTSGPSLEPVIESAQKLLRDIRTPPPPGSTRIRKAASKPELSKQRSAYFEETFSSKEMDLLGDLVRSEAIVMAEVKTNVIVHDEYTFVKELSQHLAVRYHRQQSSIVVTLRHSACIFFGGSCDPSYIMTVEALSSLVQTATNKRNVALLQQHMEQALGVPPSRGYCRFMPIPEECSGWKGRTVASQIADVSGGRGGVPVKESSQAKRPTAETRGSVGDRSTSPRDKSASPKLRPATSDAIGSPDQEELALGTSPEYRLEGNESGGDGYNPKGLRRKKSFMHSLFTRSRNTEGTRA